MTTLVVFAGVEDNRLQGGAAVYSDAREGVSVGIDSATSTNQDFGQVFAGGFYSCYQYLVRFDTTVVEVPSAATLSIWLNSDASVTDFTCEARAHNWGATVDTADFVAGSQLGTKTLVASVPTLGIAVGSYVDLTSDAAFPAAITALGFTGLVLASDAQRLGTVPVSNDSVQVRTADTAGTTNDPKLTVVYSPFRRALVSGDRVKETTTTTGTGSVTLAGAVSGYIAFSAIAGIATEDVVAYAIVGTTEWEVGIGGWHTGNLLSRDKVLASSNSGALVSFSAGSKDVFNTLPAGHGILPTASRIQTQDVLIPRNSSVYVAGDYEVVAGKTLELGVNAYMEIG